MRVRVNNSLNPDEWLHLNTWVSREGEGKEKERRKQMREGEAEIRLSRNRTLVLRRYDINSNSPSGGIKEMVRSFSKRVKRTHWWNLTSSNSIPFPPLGAPAMNVDQYTINKKKRGGHLLLDESN